MSYIDELFKQMGWTPHHINPSPTNPAIVTACAEVDKLRADLQSAKEDAERARGPKPVRMARVQGWDPGIPWDMHLRAYEGYCKRFSSQPALIQGNCRGGFGTSELDMFIPGWRNELSQWKEQAEQLVALSAECEALRADKARLQEARGCLEACSGLLRLVGTTWTDESNAHKIAHKEADKADQIIAAIDAAKNAGKDA